jgi:hypothetical protein
MPNISRIAFYPDHAAIGGVTIRTKFFLPELGTRFWTCCLWTTRVSMPKTTMNENRSRKPWQDDIGPSRKVSAVQAKPETHLMQTSADCYLRLCVPRPHARHQ